MKCFGPATSQSCWPEMRHVLCNNASMELLDREDHVPVLAPDYVAVFDGELFEVLWLDVAVVLRIPAQCRPGSPVILGHLC